MRSLIRRAAVIAGAAAVIAGTAAAGASASQTPAPAISWSAAAVFTTQAPSQTFTLTNTGGSASAALRVILNGQAFSIPAGGDTCTGTSLGPGKSCTVTVTYTPSQGGGTATLTAMGNKTAATDTTTLHLSGAAPGPTLTITSTEYDCGGANCFGGVTGTGLEPGAEVTIWYTSSTAEIRNGYVLGDADANGNFSGDGAAYCGNGMNGVYAVSTTASGATITSNEVNTPCG